MAQFIQTENKPKYIRWFMFAVLIIATALVQNTGGLFPKIYGAAAFLLIPLTVTIAMFERETSGMAFGLLAGIIWDTSTNFSGSFNAILLCIFAFFAGVLIRHLMRNNLVTALLMCSAVSLLYLLIHWLFSYVIKGYLNPTDILLKFYLPSFFYTLLFLPVYYQIVRGISKKYRKVA